MNYYHGMEFVSSCLAWKILKEFRRFGRISRLNLRDFLLRMNLIKSNLTQPSRSNAFLTNNDSLNEILITKT